jgi:hypothetical protein
VSRFRRRVRPGVVSGAELRGVAILKEDPLPDTTIDLGEVRRVNRQSAVVHLDVSEQYTERKLLHLTTIA